MKALWVVLAALVGVAGAASLACVNVDEGESGVYASPCATTFSGLLLCGRESGGAPPNRDVSGQGGADDGEFTCADACALLCGCGFCDAPGDQADCTIECEADPTAQAILPCIEQNGCNVEACI